jgi:hypothetical protein
MSTATDIFRAAALAAAVALAGCVSEDRMAAEAIESLRLGDSSKALAWSGDLATNSTYSANRGMLEAGRVNMIAGDIESAAYWYTKAVDTAVERSETEPVVKLGDVANTVLASTVTDDRTRDYQLAPYELNLALEHGIVVQDLAGRRTAALADCRLASFVQSNLAETYGADVAKAAKSTNATAQAIYDGKSAALDEMIASTANSWENPVLWWISGVLFEANGETDRAAQCYRSAAALRPGCGVFAADSARGARPALPSPGKARLAVVVGEGFVRRRVALKVPIPIYTGMSFDMPMYEGGAYVPSQVRVGVSGGPSGFASPALDVEALAARDLKEHLPGIIARNLTRAAVQAGAQAAVNHSGNEYAQLAVFVGNLVVSAMRSADLRCWASLPAGEHVWTAEVEPGTRRVEASIGLYTAATTVELKPGETKIVYLNIMK